MVTTFLKYFFESPVTVTNDWSSYNQMTNENDQIIINQIIAGNTQLFSVLVDRYKNLVFTLALQMLKHYEEAEEVSQDTFVKVYKSLHKFKGDSKFSTWIYRVTYNTCLDRLKKLKRHHAEIAIDTFTINKVKVLDNALEQLERTEHEALIKKCLQLLPGDESFLLTLYYFEEQSLEEISKVVDLKPNHIKVKLFRIRKKLATILRAHLEPEIIAHYERQGR